MKNIKINSLRAVLIIMLLGMFWTIFGFSNQNGEKSGSKSRKITVILTKKIKSIQNMKEEEKEIKLKQIEHYIRKLAHFSLYTIVGFLTMSLMSTYNLKMYKKMIISLIIGAIYAISDEFHQSFIPDRTSSFFDVIIDTSGVVFGILIAIIIVIFIKKIHKSISK